jgi:hypothetical protein
MIRLMIRNVALIALATTAGCGGTDDGTGPTGQFSLSASIDGANWTSNAGAETVGVTLALPGMYTIFGSQLGGFTIAISLANIGGTGTYPLGVGPSVAGGSVILSNTSGGWATVQSGADGSINITTLTVDRIAGTFNFTVSALTGTATGTKTVTNGQFDLRITAAGTIGPLPANAGSKVTATIGGSAWNASTVQGNLTSGQTSFTLVATNNARSLSMGLNGISGPGTYALTNTSPSRQIGTQSAVSPFPVWTSNTAGSGGSVVITSITSSRIQGTFSATIGPAAGSSATGTLSIVNGSFSHGFLFPPT